MKRWSRWGGLVLLTMLVPGPPMACGQSVDAYRQAQQAQRARLLRLRREQAVAYVGPIARGLVERHGEDAVRALAMCSPAMGRQLAAWFSSGQLAKQIPRPGALLAAIGSPGAGDVVAWWCLQHAAQLRDIDAFEAFLRDPVSYSLNVKPLETGAAEVRALRVKAAAGAKAPDGQKPNRSRVESAAKAAVTQERVNPRAVASVMPQEQKDTTLQGIALAGGVGGVFVLLVWRKRRRQESQLGA